MSEIEACQTPAKNIIAKFGGILKMSRALNHRNPSTVQGWNERGIIPVTRAPEVMAAAKRLGIDVTEKDFFPRSEEAA